jgi:hypothetical protein
MTRTRLVSLLLTVALALASTSAVLADSHDADFDPATVPEFNQDEALILFQQLQERLLAMGVGEGEVGSAVAYLEETLGNMSEADVDELLAGSMLADSDAEMGDDEFGAAEGEEPELGDEEEDE